MSIRWVWLVVAIDPKQRRGNKRKTQKHRGEERDIDTDKHGRDWTKSQRYGVAKVESCNTLPLIQSIQH